MCVGSSGRPVAQPPAPSRGSLASIRLLRPLSSQVLKTSKDGDGTTFLGPFSPAGLSSWAKSFSLYPSFSQPPALHPCDSPGSIIPMVPCRNKVATLSPFFSSLSKPWSLHLTSQGKCYLP